MTKNYYLLLGLDPNLDGQHQIKSAIARKKREWAKKAAAGPRRSRKEAEEYGKLIPEIERALSDDKHRERIRREASAELQKGREKQKQSSREELDRLIEVHRTIEKSFVVRQIEQFKGRLTKQEIIEIIHGHGKEIVPGSRSPSSRDRQLQTLETSKAKEIRTRLREVDCNSLYNFLRLHQNSNLDVLQESAEKMLQENVGKGPGVRGSNDRSALAGHCMAVFASPELKERYDNTLAFEPLDDEKFGQVIEDLASGPSGLDVTNVVKLVEWAQGKTVDAEVAVAYIATYATNKNLDCTSIDSALQIIQTHSSSQAYFFLGERYHSEKELASAMSHSSNWRKFCGATRDVDGLLSWLIHTRGNSEAAEQIRKYLGDRDDLDDLGSEVGRCMTIHALDPQAPFTFMDFPLSSENIARIAEQIDDDIKARGVPRIWDLYKSGVLRHLGEGNFAGSGEFCEIAKSWDDGMRVYQTKYKEITRKDPPSDDNELARLISITTPGSGTVKEWRSYAMNNIAWQARECEWFRNLGDPAYCGAAELLLLVNLQRNARRDARTKLNSSLATLESQKVSCRLGRLEWPAMILGIIGFLLGWLWWFVTDFWGDYRYIAADGADILMVIGLVVTPFVVTYTLETIRQAAHNRMVESKMENITKTIREFDS